MLACQNVTMVLSNFEDRRKDKMRRSLLAKSLFFFFFPAREDRTLTMVMVLQGVCDQLVRLS